RPAGEWISGRSHFVTRRRGAVRPSFAVGGIRAVNPPSLLTVELLSDTTFGRGQGTAGEVDVEVEHDDLGLPFVRGKVLHGLMRDAWLTIAPHFADLGDAAGRVLGVEADLADAAVLRVGDALLPEDVRAWVRHAVRRSHQPLRPDQILRTLTDIRRQT